MHFVLIADAYPPMKTSAAVQLRDLSHEFVRLGHQLTVILPDSSLKTKWSVAEQGNLTLLRLKAPRTKDVSYFRRAISEYMLSYFMYRNFKSSPLADTKWDGLIWYSPTIFFGKLIKKLKSLSHCSSYLILRDIFPEWAVDMGLLNRGPIYRYFKKVEKFQYFQASTIGVQTPSNIDYFRANFPEAAGSIEVLNNWLSEEITVPCCIQIDKTPLSGRKIFAYTGNIGIAQGMDILLDLAAEFKNENSVGFIFVGRGTAVNDLKSKVLKFNLDNVLVFDEVEPAEIPDLLSQCHVGLISLDPRHSNDNIPGKFLAYMRAGLPVLASINAGNDLEGIVEKNAVGKVVTSNRVLDLKQHAEALLLDINADSDLKARCQALASGKFSTSSAVKQIVQALKK